MKKILVVHYTSEVIEKINDYLSLDELELTIAQDATEALTLLANNSFDMMITASLLPKFHGFTLAKYVHDTFPHTIIIILCDQLEDEHYLQEGYKSGANEMLEKTVKGYVLQEKVLAHLGLNLASYYDSNEGNSTRIDLKPLLYNLKSVREGKTPVQEDQSFKNILKDVANETDPFEIKLD